MSAFYSRVGWLMWMELRYPWFLLGVKVAVRASFLFSHTLEYVVNPARANISVHIIEYLLRSLGVGTNNR